MYELEVKGQKYPIKFGNGFLRHLDTTQGLEAGTKQNVDGRDVDLSINTKANGFENVMRKLLNDQDSTALVDILVAGSVQGRRHPKKVTALFDEYVEDLIMEDPQEGTVYMEFVEEIVNELKVQPSAQRLSRLL